MDTLGQGTRWIEGEIEGLEGALSELSDMKSVTKVVLKSVMEIVMRIVIKSGMKIVMNIAMKTTRQASTEHVHENCHGKLS